MILSRVGKKTRIAPLIIPYFPPHDVYIELFFGAGGMFFSKSKAKYYFLNDIDEDVYNLWQVVKFKREELINEIEMLPLHEKLWNDFKGIKTECEVLRAALFLMYSNFGYLGKPGTMNIKSQNPKKVLLQGIKTYCAAIDNCYFTCLDFRGVLGKVSWRDGEQDKARAFIYADPPYLGTGNNYSHSFTEQDTRDLFDVLVGSGIRFALSEFDNPIVIELAEKHGLNTHCISERQSMKNRRTEILITNYEHKNLFN